jgi:hypothetical protein
MKKLIALIALSGGLLFDTTACAPNKPNSSASQTPSADLKLAGSNEHGGHSSDHGSMTMPTISDTTITKLTTGNIQAGTATKLVIDVKSKSGEAIDKFEAFQTKLMHLIIVSDNLQTFRHIHPIYKQKGRFEVQTNFPQGGSYTLVSDYKPAGQAEQVSLMPVKVAGQPASVTQLDFIKAKSIDGTKVQLDNADNLRVGKETMLVFKIQQANGQSVTDLQPYLGERGHLVIMRQSSPLTRADYIHAHATKHGTAGEVHFMTTFPKAGKYKMWGQFNRDGKILTTDFWVNVS